MTEVYVHPHVEMVRDLYGDLLGGSCYEAQVRDFIERLANRLVEAQREGHRGVGVFARALSQDNASRSIEELAEEPLSMHQARLAAAREHGFDDFEEAAELGVARFDPEFERAVDDVVLGRLDALRERLARRPSLVHERSPLGHRAMLIHYVAANGVEIRRQTVPSNAPEILRLLLDAGADAAATAACYSDGDRTLDLLLTSSHPAAAGVTEKLAELLDPAER